MFAKVALEIFLLPLLNADAERILSKVDIVKRKLCCRLNTQSVESLIALTECSSMQVSCTELEPNESMAASIE